MHSITPRSAATAAAASAPDLKRAVAAAVKAYTKTGHMRDAALAYAANGVPVFPLSINTKGPIPKRDLDATGKEIPGTGGFYKATCDADQITPWWTEHPRSPIGVPMGRRTGVWALDVDTPEDHAADGIATWQAVQDEHGTIKTRQHRTASGGLHELFVWSEETPIGCSKGSLPNGIEVKGHGGYIVVPPSRRKKRNYVVVADRKPGVAPPWL